jgi:hypothetical protein
MRLIGFFQQSLSASGANAKIRKESKKGKAALAAFLRMPA